jgi:L-threonylcarbamoyladenylate synthase
MCKVIKLDEPHAIRRAAAAVLQGKLVAFPTDTVYGLGASLRFPEAIEKLYAAKSRPRDKAIPVLIGNRAELSQVAAEIPQAAARLADAFWPGPLTIVLRKAPSVPPEVTAGKDSVAVRIPNHKAALELLRVAGPMAVTSANISGFEPPLTASDVVSQLCDRIDLVLDGGKCPGGTPSTIVDLTCKPPRILREGPIPAVKVLDVALAGDELG